MDPGGAGVGVPGSTWSNLECNVAEGIGAALPAARKAKEHPPPALPYSEVGAALDAIEVSTASDAVKACLRFTVLTAVRSGEARGGTWNGMDCTRRSGAYRPSA